MAGCPIDDGIVGHKFAVVDEDGPDINIHEQRNIGELVQWQDKGEDVVGDALSPAVDRVESVRGIGRRHHPLMVRFMQVLVDARVVERAVDPVDEEIGEDEEKREL